MTTEVKSVEYNGVRYAFIVRKAQATDRVQFFTPSDSPFQVGAFRMERGAEITPHIHRVCKRELEFTTELLLIQTGQIEVDFYDGERSFLGSETLNAGDLIILFEGGHGFRVTEDLTMLEIKQGPYAGDMDKIRFNPPASTTQS